MSYFTETARVTVANVTDRTKLVEVMWRLDESWEAFTALWVLRDNLVAGGLGQQWLVSQRQALRIFELGIKIASVELAIYVKSGGGVRDEASQIDQHVRAFEHYAQMLNDLS